MPKCNGLTKPLFLYNLPAIRAFVAPSVDNPYTGKASRDVLPFEGDGTARSLQKYVLNNIPDRLLPRQKSSGGDASESEAFPPLSSTVNSAGVKTSLVLLFTDRESPAPLYKALANHYDGRLNFAEVRPR